MSEFNIFAASDTNSFSSSSSTGNVRTSSAQIQPGTSSDKAEDDIFADAEEDVLANASGPLDKPKTTKVQFELQDSDEKTIDRPRLTGNTDGKSIKDAMSAWMASFTTPVTGRAGGEVGSTPSLPTVAANTANASNTNTNTIGGKRAVSVPFKTPAIAAIDRRISPAGQLWTNSVKETMEYIDDLKKQQKLPNMPGLPAGFAVPRGITIRPSGKWQAQMYYNGKSHYIGVFESKEVAALAYEMMRHKLKKNGKLPDSPYYDIVRKALNMPSAIVAASSKRSSKHKVIGSSSIVQPSSSSARKDKVAPAKSASVPKTKQPVVGEIAQPSESTTTTVAAPPRSSSSSSSSQPVVTPTSLDGKSTSTPSKKKKKKKKKKLSSESTKQKKAKPVGKKPSKHVMKHKPQLLRDSAGHFFSTSSAASVKPTAKKTSTNVGQKMLYPLSMKSYSRDESPLKKVLKTRELPTSYRRMPNGKLVNGGHWTEDEQERFLEGLRLYGHGQWKRIASVVGTRTTVQVKTHAQTYFDQGGVIPSDRSWKEDEKRRFSDGLKIHGHGQWKMIAEVVKTRSSHQVKSYARPFYQQRNEPPSPNSGLRQGPVREQSFFDRHSDDYAPSTRAPLDTGDTDTMSIDEFDGNEAEMYHYQEEEYEDHCLPSENVDDLIRPSDFPWMSTTIVDDESPAMINGDEYMASPTKDNPPTVEYSNNFGPQLGDFTAIFGRSSDIYSIFGKTNIP